MVQEHLETFLAEGRQRTPSGLGYPRCVERNLRAFLQCGIPAYGVARCVCQDCGHHRLVPFSCKGRTCPSCQTRRMSGLAAYLCDERLPAIPYRQWVMSFPRWVRIALLRDERLLGAALRALMRRVFSWLRKRARGLGVSDPLCGGIALPQRFGGRLNANPHFHTIVCDGVFFEAETGDLRFFRLPPPTREEMGRLTLQIGTRVAALLGSDWDGADDPDEDELLWAQDKEAAARFGANPTSPVPARSGEPCSAFLQGFSLHAGVCIEAHDRAALERLIRYAARPPFADDRLSRTPDGRVVVQLKRPWPTTGETELVFGPTEFLRKLAALIPPPRSHHVRYFGVFAARSRIHHQVRALVSPPASTASCHQGDPATHGADLAVPCDPGPEGDFADPDEPKRSRIAWAKLLARVFAIDVETCPRCTGPMKIRAFVTEPRSLARLLAYAGLPTDIPPIASARAPPQAAWAFEPA